MVTAISAACSKARMVKIPSQMVILEASSLVLSGTTGTFGSRLGIPPDAKAGSLAKNRERKAPRSP